MKRSDRLLMTMFFISTWILIEHYYLMKAIFSVLWMIVAYSYVKEVVLNEE